jgi:(4S)-4-hydroxy-5-phosphonooxypentane-2,3-dione isomerase
MIVLIVHMTVKPDMEEDCKRLMREMMDETRKEPGCLQYVVHQSTDNPQSFAIYEQYVDEAALNAHRDSPHFAWYIKGGIDALVATRTRELFVPLS